MPADVSGGMLQELCADLRLTWRQAGGPSLRTLGVQARLGKSQVGAILSGRIRQLPDWDVVRSLIDSFQEYAREHGTTANLSLRMGVDEFWKPRYALLDHAFRDERRRGGGRPGTSRASRATAASAAGIGHGRVVPRQLPAAVRTFAGRSDELRVLTGLLGRRDQDGATAVIAVIDGAAGMGKTTLAVSWAHRVADRFPDGQLYVNLRGFDRDAVATDPAEAVRGFLDAFGVVPQRVPAVLASQVSLFRSLAAGKRILVVLDNARDTDQVRPLLPGTPGCHVVVTSRNRLAGLVAAEGAYPLALSLPTTAESRELLAGRLGAARIATDPQAVDEIITACGQLPLALSLVAAHAAARKSLPLDQLAAQLRGAYPRLDMLTGGEPGTDVRAVFSWSYLALPLPAARLFRLLGLHPGPEIAVAAAASLAGLPARQTLLAMAELTRANMLTELSPGRYALHDLVREYAAELAHAVDSDTERSSAVRRMLDHYLHTASVATLLLYPHREPIELTPADHGAMVDVPAGVASALAWFTTEHPVLTAAVRVAADLGFDAHAWQLAWAMADFLQRRGHWHDWLGTLNSGLAATRRLDDGPGEAQIQRHLGLACLMLDQHDEAVIHLRRALDLFDRLGAPVGRAATHLGLGSLLVRKGRFDEALDHDRRALHLYRTAGHLAGQALALNNTAWKHTKLGMYRQAIAHGERALALQQDAGGPHEADTWDTLGYAYHHLGDHRYAVDCYRRALDLFRARGDRYYEASTLARLGDTYHTAGDGAAARAAWQRTLDILHQVDHPETDQIRAKLGDDPAGRSGGGCVTRRRPS